MNTQKLKTERKLTVCSFNGSSCGGYKETSEIRLRGQWLKDMGFESGQVITVTCKNRELIIRTDGLRKHHQPGKKIK